METAPLLNASHWISERKFAELTEKVAWYGKRAAKLNVPPVALTTLGERFVRWVKRGAFPEFKAIPVDEPICAPWLDRGIARQIEIRIEGSLPALAGWRFVAAVDHLGDENVIRAIPGGIAVPDRYKTSNSFCEHCNTRRKRNSTYIISHDDGTVKQIGASCLKDFLGHGDAERLAELAAWGSSLNALLSCSDSPDDGEHGEHGERDRLGAGERNALRYEALADYLPFVVASIRTAGWISRTAAKDNDRLCPTSSDAWAISQNYRGNEAARQPTDEDRAAAAAALSWAKAIPDHERDQSDYLRNLSVLARCGVFHVDKHGGIAASMVSAYQRATSQRIEREAAANKPPSKWIGEIGQRTVFADLLLVGVFCFESQWGVISIHRFIDPNGNVLVWKSSSGAFEVVKDRLMTVKATVKDHIIHQHNGLTERQTLLTRVTETKV
jgi:hypothetical protein